ncbi:hypothetical protein HHX47_DHR2000536 [Lentinula edodes]|nr:hypothetical protein HHX47_DHR2000536 [Lentinula edodes]
MQNSFTLSQRAFSRCFPRLEEDTVNSEDVYPVGWEVGLVVLGFEDNDEDADRNKDNDNDKEKENIFISPTPPTLSPLSLHFSLFLFFLFLSLPLLLPLSFVFFPFVIVYRNPVPPLLTLLPALASAHPHPFIRLSAFRLLGLVIRAAPRVLSAEGAGVDTLSTTRGSNSILASPRDVDSRTTTTTDSEKRGEREMELTRLAEVLALYYILEMRDVGNRASATPDNRANIKRTRIAPIRSCGVELDAFLHTPPDALDTSFILNALHNVLLHILLNTPDPIVERKHPPSQCPKRLRSAEHAKRVEPAKYAGPRCARGVTDGD